MPLRILTSIKFLLLLAGLALPLAVSAQVQTGTPPFSSSAGGPDAIDLANLNAHLAFSLLHKAGRGVSFTYELGYDSSVWYPVGISGSQSWQAVYNWGWRAQTEAKVGYISSSQFSATCYYFDHGIKLPGSFHTWANNFAYHDPWGRTHAFAGTSNSWSGTGAGGCTVGTSNSVTATAADGSGFTLNASTSSGTVTASNGSVYRPPFGSGAGAGTFTDTNGNQLTVSTGGVFTDTLGTTALTIAGSGTSASPLTFTYTAPSGASPSYTVKYITYTVKTNFGCSGVSEYGPISNDLISEIDLPDGSKYTFSYEPTPGYAGDVTGRLASVTFPTGGTISYSYSSGSNGITCGDGSTATLTRATPDGSWTYAHTESGSAWTTTVTDPQSNQTVLDFQGIYATQRQVYQGSTSGTLLETDYVCYNGSTSPCNTTTVTLPITQVSSTQILPGAANLQAKRVTSYSAYGLPTETDEYDYGSGSPPSTPLKKTLISYASLGNAISSRPASVTMQDGSGNTKSQTTYSYDQTAVTATSGTPQLVSVSGSRGNPTTVTYAASGTATLTRSLSYFDTGNIQTVTDVNGAQTTYTYGACGNSFPTTIAEPLGLSRSMTWNCTGGVQQTSVDENNQTTTSIWNDPSFWRLNASTDPAGNTSYISYSPGGAVVTPFLEFNGNSSIAGVAHNFDSLGRPSFDQRYQSPTATTFDTTSYLYDANGRLSSASLPAPSALV